MKTFAVVQYLVADSGHKVTIVKAMDEFEAGTKYVSYLPHLFGNTKYPSVLGLIVTEITNDIQTVLDYDNPNYEG
jgi:hypothetical protein